MQNTSGRTEKEEFSQDKKQDFVNPCHSAEKGESIRTNNILLNGESEDSNLMKKNENIKNGKWSEEEDEQLKTLVKTYGCKNWKRVAEEMPTRSAVQCLHRWTKILQPGLIKGPWTIEEDRQLMEWMQIKGAHKWSHCAEFIKGRSGKQCRERWFNTLNPNVKKGNWTAEEDLKIFQLFSEFGSKWSKIASFFSGRTENSIKNRFYSTLRRIHAEKKKNENDSELAKDCSLTSLEELLQHFPEALSEKVKAMEEENISVPDVMAKMLNKKTSRQEYEKKPDTMKFSLDIDASIGSSMKQPTLLKNTRELNENLFNSRNLSPPTYNLSPVQRGFECLNFQEKRPIILSENNFFNLNTPPQIPMALANNNQVFYNLVSQLNQLNKNLMNTKNQLYSFDQLKNNFLMITNNFESHINLMASKNHK